MRYPTASGLLRHFGEVNFTLLIQVGMTRRARSKFTFCSRMSGVTKRRNTLDRNTFENLQRDIALTGRRGFLKVAVAAVAGTAGVSLLGLPILEPAPASA